MTNQLLMSFPIFAIHRDLNSLIIEINRHLTLPPNPFEVPGMGPENSPLSNRPLVPCSSLISDHSSSSIS